MRLKPIITNIVVNVLLVVAVVGCTTGFVYGIDKQQEYNDRAELTRCQEGYTAACMKWQRITAARLQENL